MFFCLRWCWWVCPWRHIGLKPILPPLYYTIPLAWGPWVPPPPLYYNISYSIFYLVAVSQMGVARVSTSVIGETKVMAAMTRATHNKAMVSVLKRCLQQPTLLFYAFFIKLKRTWKKILIYCMYDIIRFSIFPKSIFWEEKKPRQVLAPHYSCSANPVLSYIYCLIF